LWRRHNSASSPSGGWKGLAWALKFSKCFTAVPLRASWLAASLLGMAITLPPIAWCYRGWCGQPSISLGPSSLPSRTFISGCVKGRPGKSWVSNHSNDRLFSLLSHGKLY
jgi:hypothetical protein